MQIRTGLGAAVAGGMVAALAALTAPQAIAAAPVAAGAAAAATSPTHPTGPWPAVDEGRPTTLAAGAPLGYYVWHATDGWHLEVTHPGRSEDVFSGYVTTDGTLRAFPVGLERGDKLHVGPEGHVMSFALRDYGHLDGARFVTHDAAHLVFHLFVNGHLAAVGDVAVGRAGTRPASVPFTVTRTAVPA